MFTVYSFNFAFSGRLSKQWSPEKLTESDKRVQSNQSFFQIIENQLFWEILVFLFYLLHYLQLNKIIVLSLHRAYLVQHITCLEPIVAYKKGPF